MRDINIANCPDKWENLVHNIEVNRVVGDVKCIEVPYSS
jgi:hypothetical protein